MTYSSKSCDPSQPLKISQLVNINQCEWGSVLVGMKIIGFEVQYRIVYPRAQPLLRAKIKMLEVTRDGAAAHDSTYSSNYIAILKFYIQPFVTSLADVVGPAWAWGLEIPNLACAAPWALDR